MKDEPIYVTIKELAGESRAIRWTAKAPSWIEKNSTLEVPYEPWSCADRKQRESIIAELRGKRLAMTLHVLGADGKMVSIDYDPSKICDGVSTDVCKPVAAAKPVEADVKDDNKSHIIVAGSDNVDAAHLGMKVEAIKPPEAVKIGDKTDNGFTITSAGENMPNAVPTVETPKSVPVADKEEQAEEEQAEEEQVKTAEVVETPSDDETRIEFEKCVADKKWAAALQVLIKRFGEEKITFSSRVIMSTKSYDELVEKYNLI